MLPPAPLLTPTPAGRFACIIENLCRAVAAHMAKHPAIRPLLWLAWTRLRRAAARFTRLAARLDAGPLPQRPRSPGPPNARPPNPRPPPALRLPSGRSWLIRLVPAASPFGSQLQHLLSQPDMQALLATAPQAARIFRPLCRALGAQPHPPLPRRTAAAAKTPAKPARKPTPAAPPAAQPSPWPSPGLGSFILPKPARTRPA